MKRETVMRLLLLVLVAVIGWWFVTATEWVEVEVDTPPSREVARNNYFAAERLMERLGARVQHRQDLVDLPPAGGRLLLDSRHWALFPDRPQRLRQWVESGGHLVVPARMLETRELKDWMPMGLAKTAPQPQEKMGAPVPESRERDCRPLADPTQPQETLRICSLRDGRHLQAAAGAAPLWQLQGEDGPELLRMPVGRGSVTAFTSWNLMSNSEVVRPRTDHAYVLALALQLETGVPAWVVTEESRAPLIAWLWKEAWIAVLLALLAVAVGLWRSAVRFGPVGVLAAPQRRSMREQIAGTGAFLRHHAPAALHAAQLRALREAARARLPGFAQLGRTAAAQAVARASGLPARELERAMEPRATRLLAADLQLLEEARRRLADPSSPPVHEPDASPT